MSRKVYRFFSAIVRAKNNRERWRVPFVLCPDIGTLPALGSLLETPDILNSPRGILV
jgi:hypothetical protein